MVAWVAASGGIAEDVRLRKRASRSLTKTGSWALFFRYFFGCFFGVVFGDVLEGFWRPWSPIWPPLARGREMSPKFLDFRSPLDLILAPNSIEKPVFISMKIRPVF